MELDVREGRRTLSARNSGFRTAKASRPVKHKPAVRIATARIPRIVVESRNLESSLNVAGNMRKLET